MKSYNHLWETFIDEETIRCCIVKAAIGKKRRKAVKFALDHTDSYYFYINRIAPNINFDECRGYISSYTKKHSDKVD